MRKILLFISFFVFCSCASGGKVVTQSDFSQITEGMTLQQVEKKLGEPYSVENISSREVQYLYIEKIMVGGSQVVQEKHYLITAKDGIVTSTKMLIINRPSYERNSYEMQTSKN